MSFALVPHDPAKGLGAVLRSVALLAFALLGAFLFAGSCTGCHKLPPSDGCAPLTTRCSPDGFDETCSPEPGRRWTRRPLALSCAAAGATCCWTRSPYGRELHACVPQALCLPEPPRDAGVSADATEGGAP